MILDLAQIIHRCRHVLGKNGWQIGRNDWRWRWKFRAGRDVPEGGAAGEPTRRRESNGGLPAGKYAPRPLKIRHEHYLRKMPEQTEVNRLASRRQKPLGQYCLHPMWSRPEWNCWLVSHPGSPPAIDAPDCKEVRYWTMSLKNSFDWPLLVTVRLTWALLVSGPITWICDQFVSVLEPWRM